jgi:hypothetical protein
VIFVVSLLVFMMIVAAMSVGVMAGRAPISGSCGGVGKLGIDQKCELCGGDPQVCETQTRSTGDVDVEFHDPTKS